MLVVGEQAESRELLATTLRRAGHRVEEAADVGKALEALAGARFDVIVTDLSPSDCAQLLREALPVAPGIELVLATSDRNVEQGLALIDEGAYDLLRKPVSPDRLVLSVRRALERKSLRARVRALEETNRGRSPFEDMVGTSRAITEVLETIQQLARLENAVLITGERGTGKERIARALHTLSPRADQPFVAIRLGALPDAIREGVIFGPPGATPRRHRNPFEEAAGGMLYLDGVAELGPPDQQSLLRFLQDGRLGTGGSTTPALDVRIVAATERNLERCVAAGDFNEDLYYRLNVVSLRVPPLRERIEDIPLLVRHFSQSAAGEQGSGQLVVSSRAMSYLTSRPWPGNIQELQDTIARGVAVDRDGVLGLDDFTSSDAENSADRVIDRAKNSSLTLQELEREYIMEVLAACGGSRKKTAAKLGITTATLWRKLKRFENGS